MLPFDSVTSYTFPDMRHGVVYCFGMSWNSLPAGWEKSLLPFVTQKERQTASRFANEADSARHLAGRAIARRALGVALGNVPVSDFHQTSYGKPYVKEGNMHFSISHSGQMVWVALCLSTSVGIDIEKLRPMPDLEDLLPMLHPEERLFLAQKAGQERLNDFFRCWTRKEAVLKAYGQGLAFALDAFQVHVDDRKNGWVAYLPKCLRSFRHSENKATEENDRDTPATNDCTSYDIPSDSDYQCSLFACEPGLSLEVFEIQKGIV